MFLNRYLFYCLFEQNLDNFLAGQLYGRVMSCKEYHQYYLYLTNNFWCCYILNVILILQSAKVRCALAREVSRLMLQRMWRDFSLSNYGTTTILGLDYVLEENLIDVVSERRVFANLIGDPAYSRDLLCWFPMMVPISRCRLDAMSGGAGVMLSISFVICCNNLQFKGAYANS